jgi:hypothetical protein
MTANGKMEVCHDVQTAVAVVADEGYNRVQDIVESMAHGAAPHRAGTGFDVVKKVDYGWYGLASALNILREQPPQVPLPPVLPAPDGGGACGVQNRVFAPHKPGSGNTGAPAGGILFLRRSLNFPPP